MLSRLDRRRSSTIVFGDAAAALLRSPRSELLHLTQSNRLSRLGRAADAIVRNP